MAFAFDAGEWSAILSTAFAALAAIAAFATVLLDYRRESRALRPWLSGTLAIKPDREKVLNLMNVGLGAAIDTRWAGMDIREHKSFAGIGGTGLLAAGQHASGPVGLPKQTGPLDESPFAHGDANAMWWCRDVQQRVHFWSNHDHYVRYPKGHLWWKKEVPGDALAVFREFFPDSDPPGVSPGEWRTG